MRLTRRAWLGAALAGCALVAAAQPLRPLLRADVTDVARLDGGAAPLATEASGLAWDHRGNRLVLVSDRGTIQHLRIGLDAGRIVTIAGSGPVRIAGPRRVNAESVCLPGTAADETWVVDERAGDIAVVDPSGDVRRRTPLPAPLDDTSRYVYGKRGVEAIDCHPRHGVIAIPQRPILPHGRDVHRVHAADGRVWAFRAASGGKSAIKASHLVSADRLLVLEQWSTDDQSPPRILLREIDLGACPEARPCDPRVIELADARLGSPDNFEGLACMDDTRCWIVSDGGRPPGQPTRLALITLHRD